MTWTKLGAESLRDPRLDALPRGIRLMHVEGMLYCNEHSTDGVISGRALARNTDQPRPSEAAAKLVAAGLWEMTEPEPRTREYRIVGFLNDQPSRVDVAATQDAWRHRQRRARQHKTGDHSMCEPRYCNAARSGINAGQEDLSRRESRYPNSTDPFPDRPGGLREGKGERQSALSVAAAASGRSAVGSQTAEDEDDVRLTVKTPAGWPKT